MDKVELKRVCVKPFDKDRFEVMSDYVFKLPSFNGVVPKGFKTDGASIPRMFWIFYPPYRSEYFSACIIHDYLCAGANSRADYELADKALKEAMEVLEMNKLKIFVFYHACSIFHTVKCLFRAKQ